MRTNLPVSAIERSVPDDAVLVSKTDLQGSITYCNRAFIEISGYTKSELMGQPHNLVRHPDVPQRIFAHAWEILEAGKSWQGILKNRCKNGDFYWVDANISPLREQGKIIGYVSLRYKPTPEQIAKAERNFRKVRDGGLLSLFQRRHNSRYIADLQQRLAEKIVAQEDYLERKAEEQRVASGYMNRLIALDKLHDAAAQFHLRPADNFSGDLIAMARTPDGRLHLLLADSTGHGLCAALAAMPIIHPFYSMTAKGFNVSAIAKEINHKIGKSLPVSHFVAATIVSIDANFGAIEVWCGGCPPPLLLDRSGACVHRFKSRHLAMGILATPEFDASVEYFSYNDPGYSILMFSDGVIELEDDRGEQFGIARLTEAARNADAAMRFQTLIQTLTDYCGSRPPSDDLALILADCEIAREVPAQKNTGQPARTGPEQVVWQFALTLDIEQIKKLDVVPLLLDIVQQIEKEQESSGKIFMILSELFNNALDHGILQLDSRLKHHEDGMEHYFEERSVRLAEADKGMIQMHLKKFLNDDGSSFLHIRVKDSGEGFDHLQQGDAVASDVQRHGRGIALLHGICRTVQFLGNGSEVVVHFDLK